MNIGPDYAYGRESWASLDKLKELQPDVEIMGELWPKLMEKDSRLYRKDPRNQT